MKLSNINVLMWDNGPFSFIAQKLAEDFKQVNYYTPYKGSLPRVDKAMIGEGLPGVNNIYDFWSAKKELDPKRDLICFFDVGDGDMAIELRNQGYNVFSMGNSEILEVDRIRFKEELKKMNLPVIPYEPFYGLDALDEFLRKNEKRFVKISRFRGLTETFQHVNYTQSESRLNYLYYKAGAYASRIEGVIEETIEAEEAGSDHFISDQGYFDTCLWGFEKKGKSYTAKVEKTNNLPKPIREVLLKSIPFYKKTKPRGMFSTEVRTAKDKKPYWNDATMRAGMPPSASITVNCKNFNQAVYAIATGKKINLEWVAPYVCEINLTSTWAEKEPTVIEFPESAYPYLKFQNLCRINNSWKYIPQEGWDIVGSAVGIGKTLEEAEGMALKNAESVSADSIEYDEHCFETTKEYIEKAKSVGIDFK